MATTTYGTSNPSNRKNPAIYWAVGAAIVLALIAFFSLRSADTTTTSKRTDSTMGTTSPESVPMDDNMNTAPAQQSTIPTDGTGAKAKESMNRDTPTTETPRDQ